MLVASKIIKKIYYHPTFCWLIITHYCQLQKVCYTKNIIILKMNLLIVHLGALGDLLLSRPALLAIRGAFPFTKFSLLGYPHILSLLKRELRINNIYDANGPFIAHLYTGKKIDFWEGFDQIIFFSHYRSEWEETLRKIDKRIWFIKPFPRDEDIHVTVYQQRQLKDYGIEYSLDFLPLTLDNSMDEIDDIEVPKVLIHPGSGSKRKNWPEEKFLCLIKYLAKMTSVGIIIGPAENKNITKDIMVFDCLPLPKLAKLISKTKVFIGNDSGITHLAAAVGTKTIAIFGPTKPSVWSPFGDVRVISGCLEKITVSEIISLVEGLLYGGENGYEQRTKDRGHIQ